MSRKLIASFAFAIFFALPVFADVVTVNFTAPSLYGSPGDILTFSGILTNSGSPVYINGAGITLAAFDMSAYDLTDFLLYAPWTPMANGDSTPSFDFFTLTIPVGFASGSYKGEMVVQGGAIAMTDDAVLGSANFTVQVGAPTSQVPEPGTSVLLGITLLAMAAFARLRVLVA